MFNVAIGYFPQASAPNSQAVRVLWGAQLWPRFTVDDVCYALARLAEYIGTDADPRRRQRRETFPDLGEVVAAAEEEKRKREAASRPLLDPPKASRGSIAEQLDHWDQAAAGREVGPYEAHMRELIAAGVFQGGSAGSAYIKLHPFTYQAVNGVLTRAIPPPAVAVVESEAPREEPAPVSAPGDLLTPQAVSAIVDAWQAGEAIDVSSMSVTLRRACREEVERRREAKQPQEVVG